MDAMFVCSCGLSVGIQEIDDQQLMKHIHASDKRYEGYFLARWPDQQAPVPEKSSWKFCSL